MSVKVTRELEAHSGGITLGQLREFIDSHLCYAPDDAKVHLHTDPFSPVDPGADRISVSYQEEP